MSQSNQASKLTRRLGRAAILFALLIVAWVIWSGHYQPLLLILGLFSCLLTVYLTHRMGYFKNNVFALRFGVRLLGYWAWLAKEVVRSSLDVARIVLSPSLPISPQVVEITATADHPVDQAMLGNSITLTPGTLALDVYEGRIKVHCLTAAGADDLLSGGMDRRVAALRKR
ncbi:Na+/H+ antiporter subunit E [Arenicella xantha]|uniref:Multisubunit sodium/proton antiporter MrpE subunit n=1 Tax=Arenicella xantha TaxID=644221 RepID=A0A395JRA1_9GAMM|nr:Na+/H+ antiporter subunit E [Arenicella xantha]RBP51230.1 multisubunit sodium/proton antiporter MrpE subunit [Arenicella xantha]